MSTLLSKEYVEVLEVLKYMESKYIKKIPKKMIEHFEKNKAEDYIIQINPKIPLKEQTLLKGTLEILALLNLKYWCENEEEKSKLIQKYNENNIRYQNMYDIEKIFEKRKKEQNPIVEYKETKWYNKIIEKIKEIFR